MPLSFEMRTTKRRLELKIQAKFHIFYPLLPPVNKLWEGLGTYLSQFLCLTKDPTSDIRFEGALPHSPVWEIGGLLSK